MTQTIEPFIQKKIIVLRDDTTIDSVAKTMLEQQIGCVVLMNDIHRISGIVTDRDLLKALVEHIKGSAKIRTIMSTRVVMATPSMSVMEVSNLMKQYGVRRIPVVATTQRHGEKCIGLISLDDLVAAQELPIEEISQIVRCQIKHRAAALPQNRLGPKTVALDDLYKGIAEKHKLSAKLIEASSLAIFKSATRRLHCTGAMHFIHGLPLRLQTPLLPEACGPDMQITGKSLVEMISKITQLNDQVSKKLIGDIWKAVGDVSQEDSMLHALKQLPKDLQKLFAFKSPQAEVTDELESTRMA